MGLQAGNMNGSPDTPPAGGDSALTDRVRRLEAQMAALTEAVDVLARGLESSPLAEPPNGHVEETARRTHELLLLAKSAAAGGKPGKAHPAS
jgi:hypothetical protein